MDGPTLIVEKIRFEKSEIAHCIMQMIKKKFEKERNKRKISIGSKAFCSITDRQTDKTFTE